MNDKFIDSDINIHMTDHDMLIIVYTTLNRLKIDIQELKENTIGRISLLEDTKANKSELLLKEQDYESRIRILETAKTQVQTQIKTWVIVGGLAWNLITFIILYFTK